MLASLLKYTISIYTITYASDSTGDQVRTEVLYKNKKAGVKFTSGTETNEADQRTASVKARFQIRYDATITATMLVSYENEKYDINYIEPINRDTMFLHCSLINK